MKGLEEMGQFSTVVIDPPWDIAISRGLSDRPTSGASRSAMGRQCPYPTMTLGELLALPVRETLAEDAFLFCWVAGRFLPEALQLIGAWGCRYYFAMTWVKGKGVQIPGGPYYNAELCLVGKRGSPSFLDTRMFRIANHWPRGQHSEKPEGFYDLLRRVTPAPRLDIFGRRRIAGFESWGDEAPAGVVLPDHYQQVLLDETEDLQA